MPSKGGSRTASDTGVTNGPAPAVVAAAIGAGGVAIGAGGVAIGGGGVAIGGGGAAIAGLELEPLAFTPVEEEPAVETPEWAELYARAIETTQRDRERIERDQLEAQ